MKKILAFVSSIAVCASAVAVSVLSYFPSPVKASASAPDTSQLVTTSLSLDDPLSYPTISIDQSDLVNASSDFVVQIFLSPTGWISSEDYPCSPFSYGSYDASNGHLEFTLTWSVSSSCFFVSADSYFPVNLSSTEIFSVLQVRASPSSHFDSRLTLARDWSIRNKSTSASLFIYAGDSFTPDLQGDPCAFDIVGVVGNFYDVYKTSSYYSYGYTEGASVGYSNGYSEGVSVGYSNGYTEGASVGYDDGLYDASSNFGIWDLFSNAFGSIGNILSIQLFPGLSIGLLISVPIAFAFILWLIHVLKG
jgi:hypothetical protein